MLCPWGEFRGIGQVGPREGKTLVWGHLPRETELGPESRSLGSQANVLSLPPVSSGLTGCSCPVLTFIHPNLPSVAGQAWPRNPTSFTSWLAGLGEEDWEGLAGRSSGSVSPWVLGVGGASWADTEPLCLGRCAKQLVWDFWAFFTFEE